MYVFDVDRRNTIAKTRVYNIRNWDKRVPISQKEKTDNRMQGL